MHKGECIDEYCPGCSEPAAAPDLEKLTYDVLAKRAEAAPVQLPEPEAITTVDTGALFWRTEGAGRNPTTRYGQRLYTEQQVLEMLAKK